MPSKPAYGAAAPLMTMFQGADKGPWRVVRQSAWTGDDLPAATHLAIGAASAGAAWTLRGFTSNLRYTTREERQALDAVSDPLGRPHARCAALIPIRKSAHWWQLAQDERRAIYARSEHMGIGSGYLPAVARRLHHCRDLGEPFDFLTWFEYPPEAETAFDELLVRLRSTEEWDHVEREVDIRLVRD